MADLLQEIEAQIAGAKATTAKQNVGVIREIGDGVARIEQFQIRLLTANNGPCGFSGRFDLH